MQRNPCPDAVWDAYHPAKTPARLKSSGLLLFGIRRRLGAFHLSGKQARHFWMALALGKIASLFEHLERTRYVALGEIDAGLAKDTRVALALVAGIHE